MIMGAPCELDTASGLPTQQSRRTRPALRRHWPQELPVCRFRCRRVPRRRDLFADRKRQAQRSQPATPPRRRAPSHRLPPGAAHCRTPALELATPRRRPRCRLSRPVCRALTLELVGSHPAPVLGGADQRVLDGALRRHPRQRYAGSPRLRGQSLLVRWRASPNNRSRRLVVRNTRRWPSGKRRSAMHASKSSSRQATVDGRSLG